VLCCWQLVRALAVLCCLQVPVVGISWYDGAEGNADPLAPTLAIAFENGRVQVRRCNASLAPLPSSDGLQRVCDGMRASSRSIVLTPPPCCVRCGHVSSRADHAKRGRRGARAD
jgi:hypothetical protein